MIEVILHERTQELLADPLLGNQTIDATIRRLLKAEYLRQIARYRRIDQMLSAKYEMDFDEFIRRRVPQQQGHSWEVEQDAMDWETAVGGVLTFERRLAELQSIKDSPDPLK